RLPGGRGTSRLRSGAPLVSVSVGVRIPLLPFGFLLSNLPAAIGDDAPRWRHRLPDAPIGVERLIGSLPLPRHDTELCPRRGPIRFGELPPQTGADYDAPRPAGRPPLQGEVNVVPAHILT